MRKRFNPSMFRFSLEELADLICEYIKDGTRTEKRDVLDWWKWLEKKCGVKEPHIRRRNIRIRIVREIPNQEKKP